MRRVLCGFLVSLSVARIAEAQRMERVDLPDGRTVYVVGLDRWTAPMMRDSLKKYSPNVTLGSDDVAIEVRYRLHFPAAAMLRYRSRPDNAGASTVIAVVEPQDSSRVSYRPAPYDTMGGYQPWKWAIDHSVHNRGVVQEVLRGYVAFRRGGPSVEPAGEAAGPAPAYIRFLQTHATRADRDTALHLMLTSRNHRNRVIAVSVLANSVNEDAVLYALLDALREEDGWVPGTAAIVLESVTNEVPRKVDWRPAVASLHAILNGAPAYVPTVARLLVATDVDTSLARPLLHNGGWMLLALASAPVPGASADAHALLVKLAGRDLGADVEVWRRWINTL